MKGQFPWIGRSRGSAGGMTTCKINNKNVMRAKAFEVTNPNTPAQQNQRNYFAELTKLSASFTSEQLKSLFPMKPKTMSRRNALTKQLGEDWTTNNGAKVIDFAEINTLGNAGTYDFGTTTCTISGSTISVGLAAAVKADTTIANNYFVAAIINDTKGEIILPITNNKVSTGTLSITAPASWEDTDTIHAIPLVTDSKAAVTGFGTMAVTKRPARNGRNPHTGQ